MRRTMIGIGRILLPSMLAQACSSPFVSGCLVDFVTVTWPVEIRQGSVFTTATLQSAVSRANVGSPAFEQLRGALVEGTLSQDVTVIWNVPAFGGNGGVAMRHRAVLAPSGVAEIGNATEFGGWGIAETGASRAVAHLRTNTPATVTSGSIQQLSSAPSRYRIVLEATTAAGQPLRVSGDAAFSLRRERTSCY